MTKAIKVCATFMVIASLSSCVTSVDGVKQASAQKVAVSGERTLAGRTWLVNRDCSMRSIPSVRVTQQPNHGHVEIVKEEVYLEYKSGDYKKCDGKKVAGVRGYYTSNPAYTGPDTFKVRTSYADGNVEDTTIKINVVK